MFIYAYLYMNFQHVYTYVATYKVINIISLTSIFFQGQSRVWTAASQQH